MKELKQLDAIYAYLKANEGFIVPYQAIKSQFKDVPEVFLKQYLTRLINDKYAIKHDGKNVNGYLLEDGFETNIGYPDLEDYVLRHETSKGEAWSKRNPIWNQIIIAILAFAGAIVICLLTKK